MVNRLGRERMNPEGDPKGDHYNHPTDHICLDELESSRALQTPQKTGICRHEALEDGTEATSSDHDPQRASLYTRPPLPARTSTYGSGPASAASIGVEEHEQPQSTDQKSDAASDGGFLTHMTPGEYANLTEINRPFAAEDLDEAHAYRQQSLEDGLGGRRRSSVTRQPEAARVPGASTRRTLDQPVSRAAVYQVHRSVNDLYTTSYLVFFAFLGTLARIGLSSLTGFPGSPVAFASLWANFAGSAFLGLVTEFSSLKRRKEDTEGVGGPESAPPTDVDSVPGGRQATVDDDAHASKRPSPLYIGLATGFCGSFTTFSGFMMDAFLALSDSPLASVDRAEAPHRGVGRDIMALLAVTLLTTCVCLSALKLGAHVANVIKRLDLYQHQVSLKHLDRAVVLLALGSWIGVALLALLPPDRPGGPAGVQSWDQESWRRVLFALVLAPLGCLLRFHVSLKLNGLIAAFPLGTFTVNVFGTALLGMAWDLQHAPPADTHVACQLLQGVMDGFCGCLTTVSTWVTELSSLRTIHAYVYGTASVVLSLALLVVIAGTMKWTIGWSTAVCAT